MKNSVPTATDRFSLETVVQRAIEWCAANQVTPASGQPSPQLSVRTARYYRAVGLLDAPDGPPQTGYRLRHFLQLCAVRVLQSQGLPLSRIQTLLYARPDEDLRAILESCVSSHTPRRSTLDFAPMPRRMENWQALPLTEDILLILRNGVRLTPEQRAALHNLFNPTTQPLP